MIPALLHRLRRRPSLPWCALLLLGLGLHAAAAPPNPRALRLPDGAAALRVDGCLDEPAWSAAPVHEAFVQYLPLDRQPPPAGYRTTLQIVIEPDAIVFGLRAIDPRPDEIRAPLMRRDQVKRDQDFVGIVLDPVGTRRAAQFVRVNAAGVVADGMLIAETDSEEFAPDFELEAASRLLADGYSVELRLPLLSLRYPYEGGAPWRVMAMRSIPRDSSVLLLSAPLTKDALHFIAELQPIEGAEDITASVRSRPLLSVRPELTVRSTRDDAGGTPQRRSKASVGAEIKWRPRADWVFDTTLNPDYSQVELDVPQLAGSTRFALSVPEKRPFFLESSDVLGLPLASFYSRAVTDPAWGLRSTWRGVSADATALTLRDEGGGLILLPGPYGTGIAAQDLRSQATLMRGRWHAGETLSLGAIASVRDYADARGNRVAGADLVWRESEAQQFRLGGLGSQTSALFDADGAPRAGRREDGHRLHAAWFRRVPGWNFSAEAIEVSPRFRNDNGFVDQAGMRMLEVEVIRRWGEATLPFGAVAHEFETYLWLMHKRSLADVAHGVPGGETIASSLHPGIWLVAARNTEAWVHLRLDAERARPGGRPHRVDGLEFSYAVNPAPWFTRGLVEIDLGKRLDAEADRPGRGVAWLIEANWRFGLPRGWGLEIEPRAEQVVVDAPDGSRAYAETAARALAVLHVDARDSLRAVWQGLRLRRAADATVPLAAAAERGDELSLVFQRRLGPGRSFALGASRRRDQAEPAAPVRRSELFVKASFELDP
jgi:hypothetical protein